MNKLRIAASALGIFTGIGGATHGPGEMLQGNVAPNSIVFQAWPSLTALAGEPAMTIIPNLLITGPRHQDQRRQDHPVHRDDQCRSVTELDKNRCGGNRHDAKEEKDN